MLENGMNDRAIMIRKYFYYLIEDYGFSVERMEFDPQAMGNAVLIFISSWLGIEIVVDRNQVLLSIGEHRAPREQWFEFLDVVKYFAPCENIEYIFPEKTSNNTWDEVVEIQLARLADILQRYCKPLLNGESLRITEIKKIEQKRVSELEGKFKKDSTIQ